jgi:hypothetical protein
MTTTPDEPIDGDDTPQSPKDPWDAIVADLSGQLNLGDLEDQVAQQSNPGSTAEQSDAMIDELLSEGSFEPPEPPPLPIPADVISRASWAGLLGGPVIVIAGSMFGLGSGVVGFGLVAFVGGFIGLVARMKDRHDHLDDGNDGAVV